MAVRSAAAGRAGEACCLLLQAARGGTLPADGQGSEPLVVSKYDVGWRGARPTHTHRRHPRAARRSCIS
jgi:hypothetical protein